MANFSLFFHDQLGDLVTARSLSLSFVLGTSHFGGLNSSGMLANHSAGSGECGERRPSLLSHSLISQQCGRTSITTYTTTAALLKHQSVHFKELSACAGPCCDTKNGLVFENYVHRSKINTEKHYALATLACRNTEPEGFSRILALAVLCWVWF